MLIIEGPDNSGKTTLIEELAHDSQFPWFIVIKGSGPGPESNLRSLMYLAYLSHQSLPVVILDRCPLISDPIYSHVFGRPAINFHPWLWRGVQGVVYCRPANPSIDADRPQLDGLNTDRFDQLVQAYDSMLPEIVPPAVNLMKYDYLNDRPEGVREFLKVCLLTNPFGV